MKIPRYQAMARLKIAIKNCEENNNGEWLSKHREKLDKIFKTAPHGSGIDGTNTLLACPEDRIKIGIEYHHMNENGFYDGWTQHEIIIKPHLAFGMEMKITGRDRNQIKDYLYDIFTFWAKEEIEEYE